MGLAQDFPKARALSPEEMMEVDRLREKRGNEYVEAKAKASSVRVKGGIQETFLGFRFGMTQSEVEDHIIELVREGKLDKNRQYTVNYDPYIPMKVKICSAKCDLYFDYYLGRLYTMGLIVEQKEDEPSLDWIPIIDEPLKKKGFERFDYGWPAIIDSYGTSYLKDNMDVSYSVKEHYSKAENKRRKKSRIDELPTVESVTRTLTYTDLYVAGLIRKSKEEPIRRQLESTKSDF
jgi:hypothetical protein